MVLRRVSCYIPFCKASKLTIRSVFPLVGVVFTRHAHIYVTGGAPYLAMPYARLPRINCGGVIPEGRFVLGHAGWDFHFDVPYCLAACPNLWAETSKNGSANPEALARKFGPSRLLFGSDFPFSSYAGEDREDPPLSRRRSTKRSSTLSSPATHVSFCVSRRPNDRRRARPPHERHHRLVCV